MKKLKKKQMIILQKISTSCISNATKDRQYKFSIRSLKEDIKIVGTAAPKTLGDNWSR